MSSQLITKGYAELMREALQAFTQRTGRSKGDLAAKMGMGRTTLHRLETGKPNVAVGQAEKAREYLEAKTHGDIRLPPPVVPIESVDHHELVELGAQLAREEPEYLRTVIARIKKHLEVRRADRERDDDEE